MPHFNIIVDLKIERFTFYTQIYEIHLQLLVLLRDSTAANSRFDYSSSNWVRDPQMPSIFIENFNFSMK